MPIFKNASGRLTKLNAQALDKEKNLQQLLEANLREVLDLQFLATEYVTTIGGRIDTLAVDNSGAPVIIEYKRNRNDNVINQALSYLKWLRTQKQGFFEKLMLDKLGVDVAKRIGLDWANPRVICIAESYSKFDIDTVEVVPLRIELLRFRYYEEGIFSLEPVNVFEQTGAAFESAARFQTVRKPSITGSTVDDITSKGNPATRDLFGQLRERILSLDEAITEKATSLHVAYRLSNNFAEVSVGKSQIKIHLRPIDYEDSRKAVEKIPEGYNWTMNRRVYLKSPEDLDYVMRIIEQSYKDVL